MPRKHSISDATRCIRPSESRPFGAVDDLIDTMFDPPGSVFDGFCYSSFNENQHGWLRTQRSGQDNPAVVMAMEIIDLHNENNDLRRRLYEMAKNLDRVSKHTMFATGDPLVPPMPEDCEAGQ